MKGMKNGLLALALIFIAAALLVPVPGRAQDAASEKGGKKRGPVIIEKPIVIRAAPRSPQAAYILQRASMGYEIKILEEDATAKVLQSVEDSPF